MQNYSPISIEKKTYCQNKNCAVIITHKIDSHILRYFSFLKREMENIMDLVILYDNSLQDIKVEDFSGLQFHLFNSNELDGFFHYSNKKLPNPLIALIEFSKKKKYQHYLLMENDLVLSGNLRTFLMSVNKADCDYMHIATDILGGPEEHWPINYIRNNPFKNIYFSWSQIFYVSYRFLTDLAAFINENNSFYYEFLLPTMAYNRGYSIRQFENMGYNFQLSWGPPEVYEYKYQYERKFNTFYHPIKNLSIVDFL